MGFGSFLINHWCECATNTITIQERECVLVDLESKKKKKKVGSHNSTSVQNYLLVSSCGHMLPYEPTQ